MLQTLRIENFALIEHLEITFHEGLNVLTGETGAGKSIILDALDAALGGEVSTKSVRTGSRKASLEAIFSPEPILVAWLQEQAIDLLDDGILCSREITERTSRSRLNGVLINRQQIQNFRQKLVEITAQGQTIQLQDTHTQRRWLDAFAGAKLLETRQKVGAAYQTWHDLKLAYEDHQKKQQDRLQRLDILEYQSQELTAARLEDPDELSKLEKERDRLTHVVDLQKQSYAAYQLLYQAESESLAAADLLGQAERLLQEMTQLDPDLHSILEMVSSALIQVEEAGRELYQYGEALEADPTRLNKIEKRILTLKQLCRKYGSSLAQVLSYAENLEQELADLKTAGSTLEDLEAQQLSAYQELEKRCQQLSQQRQKAAHHLQKALIHELQPLGMSGVRFQVEITPGSLSAEGHDLINFLISPNPGEPLQPLALTASGGEMSRFLLALKSVFRRVDPVSTMVFDEIDAGVSGKVAQAIASKLHEIAQDHQILCVTHQPLIAAIADHHLRVRKVVKNQRTLVQVDVLSDLDRRDELAQLTAGHAAQEAIPFVESLLAQAAQLRGQ
ncbi:MAG: DNA repair protein RecN [Cyanobacteriota bacterium]|nr:DNA repair protein RecN [Cyanobacteriota bacterium]